MRQQLYRTRPPRIRDEQLRSELGMLREELRIKDCRCAQIPARERPHFPPTERRAILALMQTRGWTATQTAQRFSLTPATVDSWVRRVHEHGPDAIGQPPEPVNRFPDFVGDSVRLLKKTCPTMGKARANTLARAGLHLGVTTVGRMLRQPRAGVPPPILRSDVRSTWG